jgi:hypothetical protein
VSPCFDTYGAVPHFVSLFPPFSSACSQYPLPKLRFEALTAVRLSVLFWVC